MGLKADLDEVATVWRSTPWRIRVWLVLSLFLASGSIASLSETVAKWKGFLLDSVNFYRRWIASPVQDFLSSILSLDLPPDSSSAFILYGLFVSANVRIALYRGGTAIGKAMGVVAPLVALPLMIAYILWKRGDSIPGLVVILFALYGGASARYNSIGGATRLLWWVYVISPLAVVGIAAAVNAGLSK